MFPENAPRPIPTTSRTAPRGKSGLLFDSKREDYMAETNKLSPEKALKKIRESDAPKSNNARLDEKNAELDEEIKRMREQRLHLERRQKKRD